MAKRNAQKHAAKPRTPKGAAAMPRAGRSSPKNKKSREAQSRSALSGKKPGNTVASTRGGQKRKRASAAPKTKLTTSKTSQRIRVGYSRPMPVFADDDDAGTRTAIAELRAEVCALRDEIKQWRAEIVGSVNAPAAGLARPTDFDWQSDGNKQSHVDADARQDAKEDSDGQRYEGTGSAHAEREQSATTKSSSTTALSAPKADHVLLKDLGTHHRQLPLELILAMFEAGAIEGTSESQSTDRHRGFSWNKSPMDPRTLRNVIRPMLEELGFITIPCSVSVSEEAKLGPAKRKGPAAGPGYLTAKGEAVARYMKANNLTDEILKKGRRKHA